MNIEKSDPRLGGDLELWGSLSWFSHQYSHYSDNGQVAFKAVPDFREVIVKASLPDLVVEQCIYQRRAWILLGYSELILFTSWNEEKYANDWQNADGAWLSGNTVAMVLGRASQCEDAGRRTWKDTSSSLLAAILSDIKNTPVPIIGN